MEEGWGWGGFGDRVAVGGGVGGVGGFGVRQTWGALGTGGDVAPPPHHRPPHPFVSPFLGAHEGDNGGTPPVGAVGWHNVSHPTTCPPHFPPPGCVL